MQNLGGSFGRGDIITMFSLVYNHLKIEIFVFMTLYSFFEFVMLQHHVSRVAQNRRIQIIS